jgi:hypothetical protein
VEKPLTILYTHNIRGDLDLLPRLYTFIRQVRGEFAAGRATLVDLGASCDPDVWPCGITQGRSTLIVLDGMGYHAANVAGMPPPSRAKLVEQVSMALVDAAHPHTAEDLIFTAQKSTSGEAALQVVLNPATAALADGTLTLDALDAGQVGVARLEAGKLHHAIHTMPAGTRPEPTISGAVDFVRAEARYFEKKQRDD